MRVVFFEYQRFLKWLVICFSLVAVAVTGYGLVEYRSTLPAIKNYEPIYQGDAGTKKVALICNVVWGEEFLPEMLQTLRQQDAKITFFVGGQWAEQYPELTEMLDREGHEIGNHGYAHLHPTRISQEENIREIQKTEDILKKITGKQTKLFHPPYREIDDNTAKIAAEQGYRTIMSSIDTIDWQRPAPEVIVERVVPKIHNGAIILMHPTDPTAKALPTMIAQLKAKGYVFTTVSDLLKESSSKKSETPIKP